MMSVSPYRIDALPAPMIGRWNELLLSQPSAKSAFLSHAFCRAVHGSRGGVGVLHIECEDGAEGFLPFQLRSGRGVFGHAENVGAGMSDFFGVVGNLRQDLDMSELLRAARLSAFRFDHGVPALCRFAFQDREDGNGTRLRVESFAKFRETLLAANKDFAKSVFSREQRLAKEEGELKFSWNAADPESLAQLIAAKRDQYRRTGVRDSLSAKWTRDLLRRLCALPQAEECQTVVSTLHAGGTWIGSKLSLICGDTLHSWFSVYDPQFRRYGPGHLVWFKAIERGGEAGIRVFDFGEGESNYKAEYGGESYELWKGVARTNTIQGGAERLLQSLQWRAEAFARSRKRKPDSN